MPGNGMSLNVDSIMASICPRRTPGASLLIARGGEVLHHRGYGMSDISANVPAGSETAYPIASISKQFVCVAALLLAKDGLLQLDEPIAPHVPSLPAYANRITLRHLMTHNSGIPDYFTHDFIDEYCREDSPDFSQEELVNAIGRRFPHLEFAPGSAWRYSNSAYVILGQMIERVSGYSLTDLLKERIFTPLGMCKTRIADAAICPPGMAIGYQPSRSGGFDAATYNRAVAGWADGNSISTCGDLFIWQLAWQNGEILSPADWQQVFTPSGPRHRQQNRYGLGWFIGSRRGKPVYLTLHCHGRALPFLRRTNVH